MLGRTPVKPIIQSIIVRISQFLYKLFLLSLHLALFLCILCQKGYTQLPCCLYLQAYFYFAFLFNVPIVPFQRARPPHSYCLSIASVQYKLIRKVNNQSMFSSFLNLFSSKKVEDDEDFVRFTYRSHLQKVYPTTYYQSDSGWGCMLRVAQMAIANLLLKKQNAKIGTIAPLFWDNSDMPFSIQTLTNISNDIYPHKKQYEWFSPCEAGFLIKRSLENFNTTYSVTVCNDNSLFLSEIPTERDNVVILIMSRIGLEKPQKDYLDTLTEMMNSKHFFCILGGTPRYAHLFLKHKNGYFGYLDPHETRKCPQELQEVMGTASEHLAKLEWIKKQKICSSMCLMYICHKSQIGELWSQLTALKQKLGEKFFLYIDENRPQVNSEDGIFEIIDLHDVEQ